MFKLDEIIKEVLGTSRKEFKGSQEEFDARIKEKSKDMIAHISGVFMSSLIKFYDESRVKEIEKGYAEFLKTNNELHKGAFDMFLMFIDLQVTVNDDVTKHFKVDKWNEADRLKFGLLQQLHIKGCQIANEIFVLLKSGYADAALARWRTLHETSVVFITLYEHDLKLSRMFFDFQFIEKLKRANSYQIHHETLNWRAIDEMQLKKLEEKRETLIKLYGVDFGKDYGWTINILPKGERNFAKLEERSGLGYLRPFYKWANNGVHSGSEGLFDRLGFVDNIWEIPRGYLAGPTRYGMTDPMQFTTYSLLQMTQALLALVDSLENKLLLALFQLIHREITQSMIEANKTLSK